MKISNILLAAALAPCMFYEASAQQPGPVGRAARKITGPLPDLTIGKLYAVDAYTVRLDVLNMGEVFAPDSIATLFIYDANGRLLERESTAVPALEPGPPVFVVFDNLGGDSGIYGKRFKVKVDSRNTIRESNEANNWSRMKIAR
jgi:subtilase family serine protease